MPQKVLIFAPFGSWIVHTQLDCVLGAALQNRGCEVRVLGCDGLFEGCAAKGLPRDDAKCTQCQKIGAEWFTRFELPVTQMRSLLTPEDQQRAQDWAQSLDIHQFNKAVLDGQPVGQWMTWVLHSLLRLGRLDYTDAATALLARELALHGALISIAVRQMIADYAPDIAICYSGSNSYYRVFCESARAAGLRVLVHERGATDGTFFIGSGMPSFELLKHEPPGWAGWRDVPLSEDQLQRVIELFQDRAQGRNTNFQLMHDFRSEAERARHRLRLPLGKKVVLALVSGDWEFGMFLAFGGLHVLWPTQFEWLETTARICQENDWQLIIRQHPLGAGRKTYPRATAFISEMLQPRDWLRDHVRVVMPAENLSTYDLFQLADAVVSQFSRAGGEAYVRGVPALCVTESGMMHMGIPVVRTIADYAAALAATIAKSPCISENELRLAYRYAHFRFFVLGSGDFKSVRIKNVYEADFRLSSPAELQPGVDPQLDRVCDHLMLGTPLYPQPAELPAATQEEAFLQKHRAHLLEQRQTLQASYMDRADPPVTVFRFSMALSHAEASPTPEHWRCRHRSVDLRWLRLDAGGGMDGVAFCLDGTAADTTTPYVYFLPENVRLDESAISQAVDALELPEHQEKAGVLFGCYALDAAEKLGPEWNTATHLPDFEALPPKNIEALTRPLTVLGLVLWRRERLGAWLAEMTAAIGDNDDLWSSTMMRSFLDEKTFWNLREPAVVLEAIESRTALLTQADVLAETDLDAALAIGADVAKRHGLSDGLRLRMARWLIATKQHARALPLIMAAFKSGQGNREAWDELQRALPETMAGKRHFDDFWPAVQTVHGFMVPGQEKFLHNKARSLPEDAVILEIGSCQGRSTAAMAYGCLGTRRRIVSVDTFSGNEGIMKVVSRFKHIFRGNLRRLGLETFVSTQPGYSHPVVRAMPEEEMFDFAFIDASHEYADVLLDFELVYPRVKPGGWIAFHDVAPGWPGSWRVWEQTGKPLLENHEVCDTLTCGRKRAGIPWNTHETEWPGYLQALIRQWREEQLYLPQMDALEKVINGERDVASEAVLIEAPDRVVESLHWMAKKETHTDPWVHYSAALVQWKRNPAEAQQHLAEARRMGLSLTPLGA